MTIRIYIANLSAYVSGELKGEWLNLPATDEEISALMQRIGNPEEVVIHDYESFIAGFSIDEYDSILELNEIAEELEALDEHELNAIEAYLEAFSNNIREALDKYGDCIFYPDCTLEDVAVELFDECYNIPDEVKYYIDYEAFARDLRFDGYEEVTNGVIRR